MRWRQRAGRKRIPGHGRERKTGTESKPERVAYPLFVTPGPPAGPNRAYGREAGLS